MITGLRISLEREKNLSPRVPQFRRNEDCPSAERSFFSRNTVNAIRFSVLSLILAFSVLLGTGCGDNMKDQPRFEPLEKSSFFQDGRSSRPLVEGTVARGQLNDDDAFYTGKEDGKFVTVFPLEMTEAVLRRGQERFEIFCSVCHDSVGYGRGMVVRRGFTRPASFHNDRLREAPPGYLFNVITNGFGNMPSYASQIKPADRWAIAGYLRVLQHSQNVPVSELNEDEKKHLEVNTHEQ